MFRSWSIVQPRHWYTSATLEQSMMDLEYMANCMLSPGFPFRSNMLSFSNTQEDDEFFKDLPITEREKTMTTEQEKQQESIASDKPSATEGRRAFSSYSYSSSSVIDDNGRRVVSTRRRYEDSTGRLKAMHKREVGDKSLETLWNKISSDDSGKCDTICSDSSTTAEQFEKMWSETPFGKATQEAIKES